MKAENLKILKDRGLIVPSFDVIKWEDRDKEIDISKYKGMYAIRSSSNIEDSDLSSFAGQFDTYLNVKDKDINKKVKDCFNSINNLNIKDYINKRHLTNNEITMDVIIQKMVDSDYSGVMFSSSPEGLLNETVITVGKGLGSGIVEDKVDTTTYYYNNTDDIYYYDGKKDYLSKDLIDQLIRNKNRIVELLGDYQDIEFAIKDDRIYILQARKITTIDDSKLTILDNSNIVESYPGVSLPLTISFVNFVYTNVFKKVAFRILHNKKVLNKYDDNLNNMVGSSSGRVYYKISNWYTIIRFLPMNSKIIPVWQEMMGVKNKSISSDKVKVGFLTRIKSYYHAIHEFNKAPKNMDYLNNKFIEVNNYFNDNFKEDLSIEEVKTIYDKVKEDILIDWDITLVNDMYSFLYTALLKNRLKKKNVSEDTINNYFSGISNIESLKPIKSLINLAYQKDKISKEEYKELYNDYIDKYGDRSLEELKLESETFRTNHKLLDNKINEYRKDLNKLNELYTSINKEKESNINDDAITRFLSKRAMLGIKNREISRLNRSRIYGMVRSMFLSIGNTLHKKKLISDKKDIFYLTIDEIFDYKNYDLKKIIKDRKEDYKIYNELPNYSRLIFMNKEFDKHHTRVNNVEKTFDKDILFGTSTSKGITEGYALVVDDVTKSIDTKDKILVTKMTDPGWVFLLATAKGVISEKGSLLSHTAIISREIGIPSIVGVDSATSIIKTGDYIKMDANSGKIEIMKRGK